MKISKLSFLFLFSGSFFFAQTQKFTIAEAVNGLRSNLAVKNISQFSWADDGKFYFEATKKGYLVTEISTQKQDTLVSLHQLNTPLSLDKKLKTVPRITFINKDKGYFTQNSQNFWIERSGKEWKIKEGISVDKNAENTEAFSDNQGFAYTIKNNLYFNRNGKVTQITSDSNEDILNGQAVHQREFGITKGIFISPDNSKIAFYRMDQSMVKDYPIIDWSVTPAVNKNIKYPMAGTPSHHVTLGVYDIKTNKTTFLNIEGDPEQYLTVITWNPDSKSVFVGVLNRDQNDLKMNQYNASTGSFIKKLFEEQSDKYVEPQQQLLFFPNSTTDFIWQSQRTGYNHLFHYNVDKGLVAQLTKGDWLVTDVLGFNEKKKEIFYVSTQESPLERHLYKVDWTNFKTQRLDKAAGMHSGVLSKDGNHLYDTYSSATVPRSVDLINTNTLKVKNVITSENTLKNYDRPEIKNVTLKADDGTPLYGKIILPTEFDANKKYPVIVYLYNGPHAQLVTDSFPALALGMEKGDPDVMQKKPRDPKEPLLNKDLIIKILVQSIAIGGATLSAYLIALNFYPDNIEEARTIAFTTLITAELLRSYSTRSQTHTIFEIGLFSNMSLVYGTLFSFALTLAVIYIPFLQPIFDTFPMGFADWRIVLTFAFVPLIVGEIFKFVKVK